MYLQHLVLGIILLHLTLYCLEPGEEALVAIGVGCSDSTNKESQLLRRVEFSAVPEFH